MIRTKHFFRVAVMGNDTNIYASNDAQNIYKQHYCWHFIILPGLFFRKMWKSLATFFWFGSYRCDWTSMLTTPCIHSLIMNTLFQINAFETKMKKTRSVVCLNITDKQTSVVQQRKRQDFYFNFMCVRPYASVYSTLTLSPIDPHCWR